MQFAFDIDYFGRGTALYGKRHRDTFEAGRKIASHPVHKRPFLKRTGRQEWYVPSNLAMNELQRLVDTDIIPNTKRAKLQRLSQWLSTFLDILSLEEAGDTDEDFSS
ncbi:MAG: hypothetical protein AAGM67_21690, partial [Bacteroidota bacterium]